MIIYVFIIGAFIYYLPEIMREAHNGEAHEYDKWNREQEKKNAFICTKKY